MFNIEYDIIDEIKIGTQGTYLRLSENIHSKKQVIQSYSSLSKQWNVMYRYNVDEAWGKWKKLEKSINTN